MQKKYCPSIFLPSSTVVRVEVLELVLQHAIERERQFREGSELSRYDVQIKGVRAVGGKSWTGGRLVPAPQINP